MITLWLIIGDNNSSPIGVRTAVITKRYTI